MFIIIIEMIKNTFAQILETSHLRIMKVASFKVSNPDSMRIKLMETLKVNFKLPATQNEMLWPFRNGFIFSLLRLLTI